jgi:hypothetical protein
LFRVLLIAFVIIAIVIAAVALTISPPQFLTTESSGQHGWKFTGGFLGGDYLGLGGEVLDKWSYSSAPSQGRPAYNTLEPFSISMRYCNEDLVKIWSLAGMYAVVAIDGLSVIEPKPTWYFSSSQGCGILNIVGLSDWASTTAGFSNIQFINFHRASTLHIIIYVYFNGGVLGNTPWFPVLEDSAQVSV